MITLVFAFSFNRILLKCFAFDITMISWTIIINTSFIDLRIDWSSTSLSNVVWTSSTSTFRVKLILDFINSSFSTTDQSSSKIFFFENLNLLNLLKIALILSFFFQIEIIRNDVSHFITFMTDEMKIIRAFSFLLVDVFSTISRLWFVIRRVFIISFFIFSRLLFCDVLKSVERLSNVVWMSIVFFMFFFKRFVRISNSFLMMNKFWSFVNAARSFNRSLMNKWVIRCFAMYEVKLLYKNIYVNMRRLIVEKIFVRMMILGQSKRRRTLFRRRKFDVLIESI